MCVWGLGGIRGDNVEGKESTYYLHQISVQNLTALISLHLLEFSLQPFNIL